MNNDQTISKYDRLRASLQDRGLFTKPSTIQNIDSIIGRAETFVVRTGRDEERDGDFIFIECMDESANATRICLPPKVSDAIASQRASLDKRSKVLLSQRRSALGKTPSGRAQGAWRSAGFHAPADTISVVNLI